MSFVSFEDDELFLMCRKRSPKDINDKWMSEFKDALNFITKKLQ